jgi:hypothetical protein
VVLVGSGLAALNYALAFLVQARRLR